MLTLEENQGERHGTHSETDEDLMVEELFLHVDSWRGFRDRLGATWGSFLFHPHIQGSIIPKFPELHCVHFQSQSYLWPHRKLSGYLYFPARGLSRTIRLQLAQGLPMLFLGSNLQETARVLRTRLPALEAGV